MWRHTKTTRRYLFDLGDPIRAKAIRVLAALTTVGARADLIHTHRQRFVGLRRQSTQRHASGVKTAQNIVDRLDIFEWHRRIRQLERQQISKRGGGSVIAMLCVALVVGIVATDHCRLQTHHHVGVVGVVLPAMDVLEQATLIERLPP